MPATGVDPAAVSEVARAARELAGRLEALLPTETPVDRRSEARQPLRLPGGVIASSAEAAEFLLRSDAAVLVDGYNVAKLAWPTRPLEAQRNQLLDAVENLARRFGSDLTVVFDGATVVGAHATRRRLVRVVWSPEGVIADDVIRDEVRRLPTARAVVVVTNDTEIVTDVKALGANVVPSNAFIAVL
jgi:predicted RNA-binding protein with PIN domain